MHQKFKQDLPIGQNLKTLRKKVGLTQAQVGAKRQVAGLDVSRGMYAQMEQGTYNIRISVLVALKDIYQLKSYDDFFQGLSL